MSTRRDFLKTSAMGGILLTMPDVITSVNIPQRSKITLRKDDTILFQGDSITDAGRERASQSPNTYQMMGRGYVIQAAGELLLQHAEKRLSVYNRGISGNKVYQLAERWDTDCIDIKPNILSILIGVNDFWHTKTHNYKGTAQTYEDNYRALLKRTRSLCPEVKLIIGEPFALRGIEAPTNHEGKPVSNSVNDSWFPEFDQYRAVAQKLANEFKAVFIPYQKIFNEAQKRMPASYWSHDGVHPSLAGAKLMSRAWLSAIMG